MLERVDYVPVWDLKMAALVPRPWRQRTLIVAVCDRRQVINKLNE